MIAKSKPNQRRYSEKFRRETSRTFRNKKREHLKGKINELGTNNRNKTLEICTEA
jgi:hypothetical protein